MKTVIVSGYFNPVHIGHIEYMEEAKRLGDRLWVIINNDTQVALKGSVAFMTAQDRFRIVSALRVVDRTFLSVDKDRSVCKSLAVAGAMALRSGEVIFANGGDATEGNVPEAEVCKTLGIKAAYGVVPQIAESSKILAAAGVK